MEALGSPSILRAQVGGWKDAFQIPKTRNANDRYNDNILSLAYLCQKYFKIITRKKCKVYVLSKNLHQSVPYAQNESCLACK